MERDLINAIKAVYMAMPKKKRIELVRLQLNHRSSAFMRKYFPEMVKEATTAKPNRKVKK